MSNTDTTQWDYDTDKALVVYGCGQDIYLESGWEVDFETDQIIGTCQDTGERLRINGWMIDEMENQ